MGGESPSCCKEVTRKAAKPHRCVECGGAIAQGESYQFVSGVWCGSAASFKTCTDCAELRRDVQSLTPFEDEWPAFGELGQECHEYGGELAEKFSAIKSRRALHPVRAVG